MVMQSFCTFLSIFNQLWFWSLFLLLLPRGSSCFWLHFWLHQGKSVNAGQPAPSVTPPGAPIQAPLMYRGSVRLWCHPQHIHTHYLVAVNLWPVSPTPCPKNDTQPSSCTLLWFIILLCREENQRHVKKKKKRFVVHDMRCFSMRSLRRGFLMSVFPLSSSWCFPLVTSVQCTAMQSTVTGMSQK